MEYKTVSPEELAKILKEHAEWLEDESKGNCANLERANLERAHLEWANLEGANLKGANLKRANLERAHLDYSSGIPLWCGGAHFICDIKLIRQVLAHLYTLTVAGTDKEKAEFEKIKKAVMKSALKSHRAHDLKLDEEK